MGVTASILTTVGTTALQYKQYSDTKKAQRKTESLAKERQAEADKMARAEEARADTSFKKSKRRSRSGRLSLLESPEQRTSLLGG